MLRTLRSKTRRVMLITLILVIPSFVLFYGWNNIQESKRGENAPLVTFAAPDVYRFGIRGWHKQVQLGKQDLLRAQQRLQSDLSAILGPQLAGALANEYSNNLFSRREIADQAVNDWILNRYAQKNGIAVSDKQVRETMRQALQNIATP